MGCGGWTGGRIGRSDWGRIGRSDWGSNEVASKIFQVSLWFTDMSFDVDVVHPTCPSLGKINFGLGKITS